MAKRRDDLVGRRLGLIGPEFEADLCIEAAVDITDDCPRRIDPRDKFLLLYSTSAKGVIVQFVDCYENKDTGSYHNWLLAEIKAMPNRSMETIEFEALATLCGLKAEKLVELIQQHVPIRAVIA